MATFTWRDVLTVSVGESSRTQAMECARAFDALAQVSTGLDDLLSEANVLGVIYAPNTVRLRGVVLSAGVHEIKLEGDEPFNLTLPLTHDGFCNLPMSLTAMWVDAMVRSNGWLIDTLKKVVSLASTNSLEPKSGSAPSSEPTATLQTMTTPGL